MRTILVFLFVFLYLILGQLYLGFEWIIRKFTSKEKSDLRQLHFVQWAFRVVNTLSGVKLIVKGQEHIPTGEPVLYIGNHRGIFDVCTTYTLVPTRTGFISKISILKVPFLRIYMKRLHCLFIDRDDIKQSLKVILSAIDLVKEGISVCIYPEGTRNKDKSDSSAVLNFKDGSFKIAQKTGCKIVPMAITGTAEVFEDHFPWIHKHTVQLTFGEPIEMQKLDKEVQKHMGAYCQDIVVQMLKEQQAERATW